MGGLPVRALEGYGDSYVYEIQKTLSLTSAGNSVLDPYKQGSSSKLYGRLNPDCARGGRARRLLLPE